MKIYLAHATDFDYEKKLYEPIRNSHLSTEYEFILPHAEESAATKAAIKDADLFVIDVSKPSTGAGIELGWADAYGKRIIAIYEKGSAPSGAIRLVTTEIIEYATADELVRRLGSAIVQV